MPYELAIQPHEQERLKQLKKYENLYDGNHYEEFGIKNYFKDSISRERALYIAINLPATISDYFADLVSGEGAMFQVEDSDVQDVIDEIVERNNLNIKIFESSITQSKCGYVPLRVRREEQAGEDVAIIEELPIDQYFPIFSKNVSSDLEEVQLVSFLKMREPITNKEIKYVFKQIYYYEGDQVFLRYELWKVNTKGELVEQVSVKNLDETLSDEPENTNLDTIPVFQVNNAKTAKQDFGKSDYKDIETLLEELNDRVTQISLQLIKHMNAKLAVPRGTLNSDGTIKAHEAEVFEVGDATSAKPEYLVNSNPQIDNGFKQIEMLIRSIASIARIPTDVLGLEGKGGAEKVEAMRIRLWNTIRKVNRKRLYMQQPLIDMIRMALKIHGVEYDGTIKIVWGDILPRDEKAITENLTMQLNGGLKSQRKAVKELQRLDSEELDDELEAITADTTPSVPSFASQPPRVANVSAIENANTNA